MPAVLEIVGTLDLVSEISTLGEGVVLLALSDRGVGILKNLKDFDSCLVNFGGLSLEDVLGGLTHYMMTC